MMPSWLETLLWIALALTLEKWLDHVVLPKWLRKRTKQMGQRLVILSTPKRKKEPNGHN